MTLDLAGGHSAGIHADDLAVELGEAPLIFGDQHRIEGAIAVTRNVQDNLAAVGGNRLLAAPVAAIGGLVLALRRFLRALFIEMESISVLSARSASALVSSVRMQVLPKRSPGERPSISRSRRSLSMLIRGVSSQSSYHVRAQNSG